MTGQCANDVCIDLSKKQIGEVVQGSAKLPFPLEVVQGSAKFKFPVLENVVIGVVYHLCLNLPAAFSQTGNGNLAKPCMFFHRHGNHK